MMHLSNMYLCAYVWILKYHKYYICCNIEIWSRIKLCPSDNGKSKCLAFSGSEMNIYNKFSKIQITFNIIIIYAIWTCLKLNSNISGLDVSNSKMRICPFCEKDWARVNAHKFKSWNILSAFFATNLLKMAMQ